MTRARRAAACIAATLLVSLLAIPATLGAAPPASASSDDGYGYLRDLYRDALTRRDTARERLKAANATYRDGRKRKRLRGDKKRAALEEISAAESELSEAENALAALPEQVRRSGAPAGLLREFED